MSRRHVATATHRFTSATLRALQPQIAAGFGEHGVYVGSDVLSHRSYRFDPFDAYARGDISDPSCAMIGKVGSGKSTITKTTLMRHLPFGRRAIVLDVKGEYDRFAQACGVEPIRMGGDAGARINPLDAGGRSPAEARGDRIEVLAAFARTALRRELTEFEENALPFALDHAVAEAGTRQGGQPLVGDVVDALFTPTDAGVVALHSGGAERHASDARSLALGLRKLCGGAWSGMLDGPTTAGLDLDGDVQVYDLSGLQNHAALPLVMTAVSARLRAALRVKGRGNPIVVYEESWAMLSDLAMCRFLQANFKLARQYGAFNILVLHRISDLDASGEGGSLAVKLARGLLADSGTKIVMRQDDNELADAKAALGLTDSEVGQVAGLKRGHALWRVGDRSTVVYLKRSRDEQWVCDTDAAMIPAQVPA